MLGLKVGLEVGGERHTQGRGLPLVAQVQAEGSLNLARGNPLGNQFPDTVCSQGQ